MSRKKGYHHSKIKDARIYKLCKQFNCSLSELKRDHSDILSWGLWNHLNKMIRQEKYVRGLKKRFAELDVPDIILVKCYYCNKKVFCTQAYSDKRKGIVFCDNRCRNRCKVDRSRYIDGTLTNRRLNALFDTEPDTYHKKVNRWLDTRLKEQCVSKE